MEYSGQRKVAGLGWADLPLELLSIISGGLGNRRDLVRFRSVCRRWRFSAPHNFQNRLSLLFPLLPPWIPDVDPLFHPRSNDVYDFVFKATCVYIVRSQHTDPSKAKAWMASVQEPAPGKLVLHDVLLYKELSGGGDPELDPDRIASTQTLIARSYAHNRRCLTCNGVDSTMKVDVIPDSGAGLVGVYSFPYRLYAFKADLSSSSRFISRLNGPGDFQRINKRFHDSVVYNGRIFAVDKESHIYHLDQTDLVLVEMNNSVRSLEYALVRFVVSDGDLYLVWRSLRRGSCHVYKLIVRVTDDLDDDILTEEVEDLGDRVFFITQIGSFSISARLLPCPWQGNRIFFSGHPRYSSMCKCVGKPTCLDHDHALGRINRDLEDNKQPEVYDLGTQTFTKLSLLQGYSDLFSPPAPFVHGPKWPFD